MGVIDFNSIAIKYRKCISYYDDYIEMSEYIGDDKVELAGLKWGRTYYQPPFLKYEHGRFVDDKRAITSMVIHGPSGGISVSNSKKNPEVNLVDLSTIVGGYFPTVPRELLFFQRIFSALDYSQVNQCENQKDFRDEIVQFSTNFSPTFIFQVVIDYNLSSGAIVRVVELTDVSPQIALRGFHRTRRTWDFKKACFDRQFDESVFTNNIAKWHDQEEI